MPSGIVSHTHTHTPAMNTSLKAARTAAPILTALAFGADCGLAQDVDPLVPVGTLTAFPMLVQTGTHPELTWDIQYPEKIQDIAIVEPGGTIIPTKELCVSVNVIAAPFRNGTDAEGNEIWGYVEAQFAAEGVAPWTTFFYDSHAAVSPTWTYAKAKVRANSPMSFRARAYDGASWLGLRSGAPNVAAFVKGSVLPSTVGEIGDFLLPYTDGGRKVKIGPKEILILMELGETDIADPQYDLQDLVLLVSMDYCKNNNGHGNNADGIDVSNPGNAPFAGPDNDTDTNGDGVIDWRDDDESTGGGAYPSYGGNG